MSCSATHRGIARDASPFSPPDHLEPRLVFAAPFDFVAVGIRFDGGPLAFFTEGVIAADDSITGTTRFADSTGAGSTEPIDWTSLIRGNDGAFTFGTRPGFTPYASQVGTQFLFEERWLVGSFVGNDAQGAVRDFAVLGQPENTTPTAHFMFDMNMTRLTSAGTVETFRLFITQTPDTEPGTSYRFTYQMSSDVVTTDKMVVATGLGRVEFDTGEILIFPHEVNSSHTSAILADLDATGDDLVGIAVGRVGGFLMEPIGDAGRLRSAVLVDGPFGAQFFGVDPASVSLGHPAAANVVVELSFWNINDDQSLPNSFRIYRQSEWDAGMRTPITQGTWVYARDPDFFGTANLSVIRLTSDSGLLFTAHQTIPRVICFDSVTDNMTNIERLQGIGSAIVYRAGAVQEVVVNVDQDGHPIAYVQLGTSEAAPQSYSVDLVEEVGGEAVTGSLANWMGSPFGGFDRWIAGRSVSGDVLLWRLNSDGVSWSFINLTESLPGARPIASDLFNTGSVTSNLIYDGTQGLPVSSLYQTLAGYDANGNFVAYRFMDAAPLQHTSRWQFVDVEADGVDGAGFVPNVVGGFAGWNSSWGAIHFAGIDVEGELWAVWWAPGMARWSVGSLTDSAGVPTLFSARPAAVQTAWDTFHVVAADQQGHVIVTWWGVGFQHWVKQDLTADFSGSTFQGGSITANFSTFLGNLNIVGLDNDGEARIYWWNAHTGWQVNSLSSNLPADEVPQTPWTLTWARYTDVPTQAVELTQSLLGHNDAGHLVRLIWRSLSADAWVLEDVTAMSVAYVV